MTAATGPAIEIGGLHKSYRSRRRNRMALDGLDLVVGPGEVHGFLGPNGSGKTTTLRALLGLVRADGGAMRIFGHQVPDALPGVIGRVGAVVESPRFFENFTARRTLRLLATAAGIKRNRVDEVLETVGLRDRAKERVKSYSLGMKQRLAIACALLKSPTLLILDEPANGLDPAGIREIRDLLRTLGATGMTVLLSSHILSEVQQICDTVTIISMGRRVVSGPVEEVLSEFDKGDVRVRVSDLDAAARLIADTGLPVRVYDDHIVVSDLADPAWITETLAKRRMYVSELTPLLPDLENVFLNLTDTMPEPGTRRQVDDAYRPPNQQPLQIMVPTEPAAPAQEEPAGPPAHTDEAPSGDRGVLAAQPARKPTKTPRSPDEPHETAPEEPAGQDATPTAPAGEQGAAPEGAGERGTVPDAPDERNSGAREGTSETGDTGESTGHAGENTLADTRESTLESTGAGTVEGTSVSTVGSTGDDAGESVGDGGTEVSR